MHNNCHRLCFLFHRCGSTSKTSHRRKTLHGPNKHTNNSFSVNQEVGRFLQNFIALRWRCSFPPVEKPSPVRSTTSLNATLDMKSLLPAYVTTMLLIKIQDINVSSITHFSIRHFQNLIHQQASI